METDVEERPAQEGEGRGGGWTRGLLCHVPARLGVSERVAMMLQAVVLGGLGLVADSRPANQQHRKVSRPLACV